MKIQDVPISKISMQELKKHAMQSNAQALWELGNRSLNDNKAAFDYWKKAAELGYADACQDLAICYQNGEGCRKNISKAIQWYKTSIQAGNHQAITNLGYVYEIKKDYTKARQLYEQAAQLNEHMAINNLANLYSKGLGVKKDCAKAVAYFIQSAGLGNKLAVANLLGHYTRICDINNGKKYFKQLQAIDKHANELYDFVDMLCKRAQWHKSDKKTAKSIELYCHAADLGCTWATQRLLDYRAKNCAIKPNKAVIMGIGNGAASILNELSLNKNSKKFVTVAIGHSLNLLSNCPADINISLKAEGSGCRPTAHMDFAKITDFIDCKLSMGQKLIVVGHGGGDSRKIFQFVVDHIKKQGRDFKIIMPTPFFWEAKKRHALTQELIDYFKTAAINATLLDYNQIYNKSAINATLLDYNQIYNKSAIGTISQAFSAGNHFAIKVLLAML